MVRKVRKKKAGQPEKYNIEFCFKEIKEFYRILFEDGKDDGKVKYFTWHDIVKTRPYSRQRISEWRKKFKKNREFSDTIKKIDEELENRIYKYALLNKVNVAMAIFSLKNNYGWKDKIETEHSGAIALQPITGMQIIINDSKD